MKRLTTVIAMQLIALLATMELAGAATAPSKIVIAYASLNERGAGALLVARDQGFFRKHDLDVNLIYMRNAAVALSALSGYATMLKKQGFRVMADLTKLGVPFQ